MTVPCKWVAPVVALWLGCGGGGAIGTSCESQGDCADSLQCLANVCSPLCSTQVDCGDGFLCTEAGTCQEVHSEIGDPCTREIDCGPGQACLLDPADGDRDGRLEASCQPAGPGAVTGSDCVQDDDCKNKTCVLGRCTELCQESADCPGDLACTDMPRLLADSAPLFRGCLQPDGVLDLRVPITAPFGRLRISVPGNARSLTLVTEVGDATQLAGVSRLADPTGAVLYSLPDSDDAFYANPLRYRPQPAISALLAPNTPDLSLETGVYTIDAGSFLPAGGTGTEIPTIRALFKLDDASTLDLHFVFLDLADHPCSDALDFPSQVLAAGSAPLSDDFQTRYVGTLRAILEGAGLKIGNVTYSDLSTRPDADGLQAKDLGGLLTESREESGVEIFLVRSIAPAGIQALSAATPGVARSPGTRASGVAVSLDTLCYRDWQIVARATAHAIAAHLGLFRNREPDGHSDPIPDSDTSSDNLMFFGEFGGVELSAGQRDVLRRSPALRAGDAEQTGAPLAFQPLPVPAGDPDLVELLSGIDFVPSRSALDAAAGGTAESELLSLSADSAADSGLRIRAYRALAQYPGAAGEAALRQALSDYASAAAGLETLYLRAAMRSLAEIAGGGAVDDIAPLLNHPSRDVRTDAAFALAASGSADAIPLLRARLNSETEDQVKLALSAAIRELSGQ